MSDEVSKEIDDMLKGLGGELSEPVEEKEEVKEEIKEEKEEEKKEVKEEEEKETIEGKKEDKKEEEKEEVVLDEKDKVIIDLREKLAAREKAKEEVKENIEEKKEEKKEEPLTVEPQDFIGDLDLDDLIRDKDGFNKLLNSLYTKGLNDARKIVSEGILRDLPNNIRTNIEIANTLKATSDKFYEDNEDLKPFKKVVSAVFEDLASQSPGKKYNELLPEIAIETRKRLGLDEKTIKDIKDKREKIPKLPTKKGSLGDKHEKSNISPLQAELDEMNKSLLGG